MITWKEINDALRHVEARPRPWAISYRWDEYKWARCEHAWLLKAEGLRLVEIGAALGVTRERARQMVTKFRRRAYNASRKAHWRIDYGSDAD